MTKGIHISNRWGWAVTLQKKEGDGWVEQHHNGTFYYNIYPAQHEVEKAACKEAKRRAGWGIKKVVNVTVRDLGDLQIR